MLSAVLVVALSLGSFFVQDFGQGTDEYIDFEYANNSLRSYVGDPIYIGPSFEELHGPFHMMFALVFGRIAVAAHPMWTPTDGRHLANLLVFVVGIGGLYILCRRYVSWIAAVLSSSLFATQPMLLGHGFINEKDTAFMVYFLLAFVAGLSAVDRLDRRPRSPTAESDDEAGGHESTERLAKGNDTGPSPSVEFLQVAGVVLLLVSSALTLLGFLFLPGRKGPAVPGLQRQGCGSAPVDLQHFGHGRLQDTLELYVSKLEIVYAWTKVPLALGWLGAALILMRRSLPHWWRRLIRHETHGWLGLVAAGTLLGLANFIGQLRHWQVSWLAPTCSSA